METAGYIILASTTAVCVVLVHQYAQKEVRWHIKAMTAGSWLFCFLAYSLLPFDIYLVGVAFFTNQTTHHIDSPLRDTVYRLWNILYWGIFFFSWILLPFFMYYETAGEFDVMGKIKRSLIDNLLYYLYFGLAALPLLTLLYWMGLLEK